MHRYVWFESDTTKLVKLACGVKLWLDKVSLCIAVQHTFDGRPKSRDARRKQLEFPLGSRALSVGGRPHQIHCHMQLVGLDKVFWPLVAAGRRVYSSKIHEWYVDDWSCVCQCLWLVHRNSENRGISGLVVVFISNLFVGSLFRYVVRLS